MENNDYQILISNCKYIKVLYIEDNDDLRNQTIKMLENFFDDIVGAIDGKDGLDKFNNESFDLVLTDIQMPNINGIEMIKQMRKTNTQIPIIIFSAYTNTEYFLDAITSGVDGYLVKPVNFKDLSKLLEKVMNKFADNIIPLSNNFYWKKDDEFLYKDNATLALTKNETKLFNMFIKYPTRIFSADNIEVELFDDLISDNKRVRNIISRLKLKLDCELIETIYAQGYKLKLL